MIPSHELQLCHLITVPATVLHSGECGLPKRLSEVPRRRGHPQLRFELGAFRQVHNRHRLPRPAPFGNVGTTRMHGHSRGHICRCYASKSGFRGSSRDYPSQARVDGAASDLPGLLVGFFDPVQDVCLRRPGRWQELPPRRLPDRVRYSQT